MRFSRRACLTPLFALAILSAGCGKDTGADKDAPAEKTSISETEMVVNLGGGAKMKFLKVPALNLWVGQFEVSNLEYRRLKKTHDSGDHKGISVSEDDQPVVNVTWNEAKAFCDWLNKEHGMDESRTFKFRLPTGSEWETYALAGKTGIFPWGNNSPNPPGKWNYYGEENKDVARKIKGHNDGYEASAPVRKSGKNALGLFGVGGNVWEWTDEAYDESDKYRVYRGGSWADAEPLFMKVARRSYNTKDYKGATVGFRVVAEVAEMTAEQKAEAAEALKKKAEAAAKAEAAKAEADRAAAEASQARESASKAEQERAKIEKREMAKNELERLLAGRRFDEASARLEAYAAEFGKDDYFKKNQELVKNIKILSLSEGATMEFMWVEPLGLWVGKYEVSNKQYKLCDKEHSSGMFKDENMDGDSQPVIQVSYNDAEAYCKWLTDSHGAAAKGEFRLPTEQEWETFALCGQQRDFPWGSEWPPTKGNYGLIEGYDDGYPVSCPITESGDNEWGIFGVGGNVWEWCQGSLDGTGHFNVFRGGAWNLNKPDSLRIANRAGDAADTRSSFVGFRVVLNAPPPAP